VRRLAREREVYFNAGRDSSDFLKNARSPKLLTPLVNQSNDSLASHARTGCLVSKVSIKPEILRWARQRADIPVAALRRDFSKYEKWERGEDRPTLKQLEKLAKRTYTPLGYFFLPKPPEERLPIPDFRTLPDREVRAPSPNLLESIQSMQRRQSWMREYLIEEGQEPLGFLASAKLSDEPEQVVPRIRSALGLPENWAARHPTWTEALHGLRLAAENARVLPMFNGVVGNNTRRKLSVEEFRGFVLIDEYAPLIFVNAADAKAAQMFTLTHELAHLWIGKAGVFNLRRLQPADDPVEQFCDRVAAEFLAPAETMRTHWPEARLSDDPFQTLARRFKVSPLVIARRALDLQLIPKAQFSSFYRDYMESEKRRAASRSDGGDFYATHNVRVGRRFSEAVIRSAREDRILYREAYQLTGLAGKTFDEFAKRLEAERP